MILLKATHIDMVALRDVQEDTINEEQESFDVEELAPTEAQIEEELCQSLVVDTLAIELVNLSLLSHRFHLSAFLKAGLLFGVHESLIFLVKLLTAFFSRVVRLFFIDLVEVASKLVSLLLFLLFPLKVNLPVLFSRLTR